MEPIYLDRAPIVGSRWFRRRHFRQRRWHWFARHRTTLVAAGLVGVGLVAGWFTRALIG